jgi:hypothetical protein
MRLQERSCSVPGRRRQAAAGLTKRPPQLGGDLAHRDGMKIREKKKQSCVACSSTQLFTAPM